jgi:hypothetical protein
VPVKVQPVLLALELTAELDGKAKILKVPAATAEGTAVLNVRVNAPAGATGGAFQHLPCACQVTQIIQCMRFFEVARHTT